MSKHTMGPWTYKHENLENFHLTSPYLSKHEAIISGCGCCGSPRVSSEADARLIAAAPVLLAALKTISDWAKYGSVSDDFNDIKNLADEAVGCATGEEK